MAKNGRGTGRKKRGSSKTKKTVDKADTVEVNKVDGELELKSIEIDDNDFDMHYKAMKGAKEKFDTAKRLYDGCCKGAKKVSEELLDAVKRAMKFDGMQQDEIKRILEIDGYVLRKTGSAIQLTLHNALIADTIETAYKRGFDDGIMNKGNDNRYPTGSDLAERYDLGWQEGCRKKDFVDTPKQGVPNGTNSGEPLPMN